MSFEGLIFEIGDAVGTSSLMAMPKWTRYNASTNVNTPVSNTYRLDVYGVKSDQSPGRSPQIHSGWMYAALNAVLYSRSGVLRSNIEDIYLDFGAAYPIDGQAGMFNVFGASYTVGFTNHYAGLIAKQAGGSASATWQKFMINLKEVV